MSKEAPSALPLAVVERMGEGALVIGADGTIEFANAGFLRLAGTTFEEAIGAPLPLFVPDEYHATLAGLVRAGLEGVERGEIHLQPRSGEIVPVQLTLSPLADGARCCTIVFDLRGRQRLEGAHAARAAAEEASRVKEQFLAVLSHELRAPLNTMIGWAQVLVADGSLGETSRRAAATLERAARAQAALVDDLLDLARVIAGRLQLDRAGVDLRTLVEAALSAAGPQFEQKNVRVSSRLCDDADVYGDPARLRQIVSGLLHNALKFTKGGAIEVALDVEGDDVVFRVRHTGIGMSANLVGRVFDAFESGSQAHRRAGGLGLGLALSKQLAEAHGGSLAAASEGEGQGSTFTLRLPRVIKSVRAPRPRYQPRGELKGLVALLVDDDRDNLELTQYLLESAGCEVATASSAQTALDALSPGKFGLLVSDIGLPDRDGLELIRAIRSRGYGAAELPAIALTGYSGLHDARLVTAAGFQRHLSKPLDGPSLIRAARELGRRPEIA